jgi:uncharacterized protein (TIGR02246 family)
VIKASRHCAVEDNHLLKQNISAVLILIGLAFTAPIGSAQQRDEAQIRDLQERQAAAWNQHDASAYAALLTEDGEVVNVVGWWWKGRQEIETKLKAAFTFVFKTSTLTITDVQVRFLKPDIAIAHVRWTMTGAKTPPGVPEPKQGIEIQVLKKQQGKWLIMSFQNTSSIPEVPFPLGPPSSDARSNN